MSAAGISTGNAVTRALAHSPLIAVVLYLAVNLLVDLSYRFLDPRVELQ